MGRVVYLVDSENISNWMDILPYLSKRDRVIVFHTDNSPKLSVRDSLILSDYVDKVSEEYCVSGSNALDFQLSSHLGFLIRSAPKTEYVILSNDKGYFPLTKYWDERGADVRLSNIKDTLKRLKTCGDSDESYEDGVISIKSEKGLVVLSHEEPKLKKVIKETRGESVNFHNSLVKEFGATRGLELFKALKPQLIELYYEATKHRM